jgi:hypothetical protein
VTWLHHMFWLPLCPYLHPALHVPLTADVGVRMDEPVAGFAFGGMLNSSAWLFAGHSVDACFPICKRDPECQGVVVRGAVAENVCVGEAVPGCFCLRALCPNVDPRCALQR